MKKARKPLVQRTPLTRKTPLRNGASGLGGEPSRAKSEAGSLGASPVKPRKAGRPSREEKQGRELLKARSGGVCETQVPGHCWGTAAVWSHRKRRSQSTRAEKWSPANGLASCLPCELYLTEHDTEASVRANGWTVPSTQDPRAVAVLRRSVYVWLFDDGSFEVADLSEIAEQVVA